MVINWYGEASFKIQSGNVVILTDPFESAVGLTAPRFKSDIVLKSQMSEEYISEKSSEARNIFGPGEYEVKGVEILGFPAENKAVYAIRLEDMKLGFLGELGNKELSAETMEALRGSDILFVPAGGEPYIDVREAVSLIKKLEPKIVIPSLFKVTGLKRKAGDISAFAKEMGQKGEEQEKLTIKAKEITWEGSKLVILSI